MGGWGAWWSVRVSGAAAGLGGAAAWGGSAVDGGRLHRLFQPPPWFPLWRWLSLSCGLRAGGVHALTGRGGLCDRVRLNDRFYVESDVVRGWRRVGATLDPPPPAAGAADIDPQHGGEERVCGGLRGGDAIAAAGLLAAHCFVNAAAV
eukprot:gene43148-39738_t